MPKEVTCEDNLESSPSAKIFRNPYTSVFKKLFGANWKPMIALHKCLTFKESDLVDVLNIDSLCTTSNVVPVKEKKDTS